MTTSITLDLVLWALTLTFMSHAPGVKATNCTCVTVGGEVISANCSDLGWREVPRDLPPTLLSLNLSGNLLTSVPPSSFSGFPRLKTLDLGMNRVAKLHAGSFRGLSRLRWLSLRSNLLPYFPGTFPAGVFRDPSHLTYLDLQNQTLVVSPDLTYPDAALSPLGWLRTLRMDGVANNASLGPGFAGLRELEVLDISKKTGNCPFRELSERFFASLNTSRPLVLNLTGCELRKVHRNTFSFLPTLRTLDLCSCRHFSLPAFMEASESLRLTGVKVLNISYTHHRDNVKIKAEYFKYLGYTWLEHFRAEGLHAYDVELGAVFNLPTSMRYLSFYDNRLINATFLHGLFVLPHMETLQVSRQNHYTSTSTRLGDRPFHSLPHTRVSEGTKFTQQKESLGINMATSQRNQPQENNIGANNKVLSSPSKQEQERSAEQYGDNAQKAVTGMRTQNDRGSFGHARERSENAETNLEKFGPHSSKGGTDPHEGLQAATKELRVTDHSEPLMFTKSDVPPSWNKVKRGRGQGFQIDPSVCVNGALRTAGEQAVDRFLRGLKSFLSQHHLHFRMPANRSPTASGQGKTTPRNATGSTTPKTESAEVALNGRAGERNTDQWLNFQDDFVPFPPMIRFFFAGDINLGYVLPRLHFFDNSLEVVDLSNDRLPCFVGPWRGLHKLRRFNLSRNFAVYLNPDFFEDMPSLTHLFLRRNFLGESLAEDLEGRSFSRLQSLEVLDLADNYIKHLPVPAFRGLGRLKSLSLAGNAISRFKTRVGHLTSLSFLDLSDNNIHYLGQDLMQDLDAIRERSDNFTVDLHRNDLSCGCDALPFWFWVVRETRVRLHRRDEYRCTLANGTRVGFEELERELDFLWLQCQGQRILTVAVALLSCLLVVLMVLGEWSGGALSASM